MANYTPPASFSASHAATNMSISQATSSSVLLNPEIAPSTLDTLPTLSAILTRLQSGSTTSGMSTTTTTSAAGTTLPMPQSGSPHVSQSQTLQTAAATATGGTSSPFPSASAASTNNNNNNREQQQHLQFGPLTTKDIPAATDDLKSGLKKARTLVAGLPDMHRAVEEQELEISELEARIREQRSVLERLKVMGSGGGGVVEP